MTDLVVRCIVLSLAWFAAVNAIASPASAVAAWAAVRLNVSASRVLLAIRLFPAIASLVFAGAMFLPAQWAFEPRDADETFGVVWFALAAVGAALLTRSVVHVVSIDTVCRRLGRHGRPFATRPIEVYEVDDVPGVSLAGVLRPRILIGPRIVAQLSAPELDVAIAHEVAHLDAFDNFSRWCMLCAPDFLTGSAIAGRLEEHWRELAECRADSRAVRGDTARAVDLASALIKVARLSANWSGKLPAPSWSTLHDSALLELRVRRLVNGLPPAEPLPSRFGAIALSAAGLIVAVPLLAGTIHRVTEALVAALP
jgi:hypothetical protein